MNNNTNEVDKIDIKRMLEILLDRIVIIIIVSLLAGVAAFGISKFIPPRYESYITMFVNNQKNYFSMKDEQTKTSSGDISASQQLVPTYVEMIKSTSVLQAVCDKYEEKTGEGYNVSKLKGEIEASSLNDTEILKVTVRNNDAAKAMELANLVAEVAPEKIQSFIERSDVRIVDKAKESTSPVSPNVRNNTIIGLLLGLALSVATILLLELFDVRVKTPDDLVAKFNLPVLGSIPEIFISVSTTEENDKDKKSKKELKNG